ncbi:MAG: hypothetical protein GX375_06730 [Clostridiales bacterium]|nr:hypothetical protein [Clostridiales bacterium]
MWDYPYKTIEYCRYFSRQKWSRARKLRDMSFNVAERVLTAVSIAMLALSAYIEAILVTNF